MKVVNSSCTDYQQACPMADGWGLPLTKWLTFWEYVLSASIGQAWEAQPRWISSIEFRRGWVRSRTEELISIFRSTSVLTRRRAFSDITIIAEIVPALLDHLRVKHVTLVSHSAGTIYLLNTVLHHRHVLHPRKPYVALLGTSCCLKYTSNLN